MAVRRVRRIVRKIDPWTVLKVSLVLNAIGALIFVLGTWVVWSMSLQRGIPDRFVEIFESMTLTFTPDGELYFRVIVMLAIVGGIVMTGLMTLGAVMYNLISDMVGGIEITVLEETYNPVKAPAPVRVAPATQRQTVSGNGAGTASGSADAEPPVVVPQAKSG
jgi:hypothetical protein